jgi:hypothetical protein
MKSRIRFAIVLKKTQGLIKWRKLSNNQEFGNSQTTDGRISTNSTPVSNKSKRTRLINKRGLASIALQPVSYSLFNSNQIKNQKRVWNSGSQFRAFGNRTRTSKNTGTKFKRANFDQTDEWKREKNGPTGYRISIPTSLLITTPCNTFCDSKWFPTIKKTYLEKLKNSSMVLSKKKLNWLHLANKLQKKAVILWTNKRKNSSKRS